MVVEASFERFAGSFFSMRLLNEDRVTIATAVNLLPSPGNRSEKVLTVSCRPDCIGRASQWAMASGPNPDER